MFSTHFYDLNTPDGGYLMNGGVEGVNHTKFDLLCLTMLSPHSQASHRASTLIINKAQVLKIDGRERLFGETKEGRAAESMVSRIKKAFTCTLNDDERGVHLLMPGGLLAGLGWKPLLQDDEDRSWKLWLDACTLLSTNDITAAAFVIDEHDPAEVHIAMTTMLHRAMSMQSMQVCL